MFCIVLLISVFNFQTCYVYRRVFLTFSDVLCVQKSFPYIFRRAMCTEEFSLHFQTCYVYRRVFLTFSDVLCVQKSFPYIFRRAMCTEEFSLHFQTCYVYRRVFLTFSDVLCVQKSFPYIFRRAMCTEEFSPMVRLRLTPAAWPFRWVNDCKGRNLHPFRWHKLLYQQSNHEDKNSYERRQ